VTAALYDQPQIVLPREIDCGDDVPCVRRRDGVSARLRSPSINPTCRLGQIDLIANVIGILELLEERIALREFGGSRQTSRGETTFSNLPRIASFSRSQLDWGGHDGSPGRARSNALDHAAFAGSAHPISEGRAQSKGIVPALRRSCLLFTVALRTLVGARPLFRADKKQ